MDLARWTIAFYRGQSARYGIDSDFRELGYLILAFDEERGARGARARRAAARRRARLARGGRRRRRARCCRSSTRRGSAARPTARRTARCRRRATWPPALVALRAAGGELRERTPVVGLEIGDGRVSACAPPAALIATRAGAPRRRRRQPALSALGRRPGRPRRRRAPPGRGDEPGSGAGGGPAADGVRPRTRALFRQHEDGLLFGMSNPDERPGEATAIDWEMLTRVRARLSELLADDRALELRRVWAATIDYTPDHLPILGPLLDAGGDARRRARRCASAGGHADDVGPRRRPRRRGSRARGRDRASPTSRSSARTAFDEHGRSRIATDPIALPFPAGAPDGRPPRQLILLQASTADFCRLATGTLPAASQALLLGLHERLGHLRVVGERVAALLGDRLRLRVRDAARGVEALLLGLGGRRPRRGRRRRRAARARRRRRRVARRVPAAGDGQGEDEDRSEGERARVMPRIMHPSDASGRGDRRSPGRAVPTPRRGASAPPRATAASSATGSRSGGSARA